MDDFFQIWRWIFPLAAFLNILAACLQYRIPIKLDGMSHDNLQQQPSLFARLTDPWKTVWELIYTRQDFRGFHIGYMLGGFGLVIIQPALPVFFIDRLHLSYVELTTAITLCKGVAFALASPLWARWLRQVSIYQFSCFVALLAGIFPFFLISAEFHLSWVFVAYLLYGVMQSGSELSWHLAGPIFAKGEDSSSYSSVNLAVVGLAWMRCPLVGQHIDGSFSPAILLVIGGADFAVWQQLFTLP